MYLFRYATQYNQKNKCLRLYVIVNLKSKYMRKVLYSRSSTHSLVTVIYHNLCDSLKYIWKKVHFIHYTCCGFSLLNIFILSNKIANNVLFRDGILAQSVTLIACAVLLQQYLCQQHTTDGDESTRTLRTFTSTLIVNTYIIKYTVQ